ncbi:MAG: hypothetical protein A2W91_09685 [Bacteroidetes bacterium GWF2_38_335]|nr:MAG: hypothetical protein A2W91_09685 [Bacteroidetes bacterium GWF2_38_335]OFY78861.1 MAG: hypothetical protein A2281_14020 [Bacteroidetes bacterium RIFOXYA12_FULL_38_20]HBS86295.1 hypothetical protein [Bacteroidales bacterium]
MKRLFLFALTVVFLSVCQFAKAQDDGNNDDKKDPFKIKMASAWLKFNDGDYYGALRVYRDLHRQNPKHAMLNYRMGKCFLEIREMDTALVLLENSIKLDSMVAPDVYFLMGKAYQYNTKLDEAIESYYNYKRTLNPKQNETHFVNVLLRQCHTAKELMEKPVNVQIKNLEQVNSAYTDACPSISADSKTLIFTSRNPSTTGGTIDYNVEEYYDDIYISKWDDDKKTWGTPVNIGEPINTDKHDANTSLSPDGNTIYIYKNNEETKSGDIYYSKLKDGKWSKPKPFEPENKMINSTYFESSACVTADGGTMFFVSEREKGGFGHGDIYMVKRLEDGSWGKPENLGYPINTEYDEIGVYIHPDGKTLFFSSDGHNTMGEHDIFMTYWDGSKWSVPQNMGYPINTTKEEIHFVFNTNRDKAYVSSTREGGKGKYDIYEVEFNDNKIADTDISAPPMAILRGTVVDAVTSEPIKTSIEITDQTNNKTKIITSDENGNYFVTLPADIKYEVTVRQKGYKPLIVKFKLPKGENDTPTLIKHLLLDKEK